METICFEARTVVDERSAECTARQILGQGTEYPSRSRTLPVCVTFDMQGVREEPPGLKERIGFLALMRKGCAFFAYGEQLLSCPSTVFS